MPSTRLLSRVVATVASISAGAVLTRRDDPDAPPAVAAALLRLVAETIASDPHATDAALSAIESQLRSLVVRYGTLGLALGALASGRRRHPAIGIDKTQGWARSIGLSVSAIESNLRKYPKIMLEISRWMAAEGESLEAQLNEMEQWLDADVHAAPPLDGAVPATETPSERAGAGAVSELSADVALARRLMLDNKPLSDGPSLRRRGALEQEVVERLMADPTPLARATGLIALGRFDEADPLLREIGSSASAADGATLKGDRRFFDQRFDDAVECYRAARASRDDLPARLNLAAALVRARKPSAETAQKEAIDLLGDTLTREPEGSRGWGLAAAHLGAAWLHLGSGDRDANVRRAIERLEAAVTAFDREEEAQWWAQIHAQLGSAWMALPTGKRVENLQRAITCLSRAGEVWTRQCDPERWAAVQNGLGHAWEQLPLGHRAVNLEKAIGFFSAAMEVIERESSPSAWAMLQNNLGNAWVQMPRGELRENIERAIGHHSAALEVWSAQDRRPEWAATQNNLGNAWALLPAEAVEAREKGLRRAVSCYKSALEVRTRNASPAEWATTQNNMGSALLQLARTAGGKTLDESIICFERALEVRTRDAYPLDWARTQANLGHAWARKQSGDRAEHLRKAVACYTDALSVLKREQYPHLHDHIRLKMNEAQDKLDEASLIR